MDEAIEEVDEKRMTIRFKGETFLDIAERLNVESQSSGVSVNALIMECLLRKYGRDKEESVQVAVDLIRETSIELTTMLDRLAGTLDDNNNALRRNAAISIETLSAILSRTYLEGPLAKKMEAEAEKIVKEKIAEINKTFPMAKRG